MLCRSRWGGLEQEGFGIVFAEALACGTPVISCPRGAVPEIVEQGVHGFLIRTVEEGARAVVRLGNLDRGACRRRVEERFTADIITRKYLALYGELIRQRQGAH